MATTSNFGWPTPDDTDLVRDGAAAIRNLGSAVDTTVALGFRYVGTRFYTSSGTFVKADPFGDGSFDGAKLRAIRVRMVGGGGGGGGCVATDAGQNAAAGAGGSGAYAESFITNIAGLATSETVTRGDGGTGGTAGANSGSVGGNSSFGTLVVAPGGGGGGGSGTFPVPRILGTPGGGGSSGSATGDIVADGSSSARNFCIVADFVTTALAPASALSGSRVPAGTATGANGLAGLPFGGAGGGGLNAQSQATARAGGAGAAGIVIVDVFA